jgi:hypothetical protein
MLLLMQAEYNTSYFCLLCGLYIMLCPTAEALLWQQPLRITLHEPYSSTAALQLGTSGSMLLWQSALAIGNRQLAICKAHAIVAATTTQAGMAYDVCTPAVCTSAASVHKGLRATTHAD